MESAKSLPLKEKNIEVIENQEFTEDVRYVDLSSVILKNVSGKATKFEKVKFNYSRMHDCYFRDANFVQCDFTGAKFYDSNFRGAKFEECKFDYSRFNNTIIHYNQLKWNLPKFENLRRDFLRNLRKNFEAIGDVDSINECIIAELKAERTYKENVVWRPESYYRKKYTGLNWVRGCVALVKFRFLDLVWGNGESFKKLVYFTIFCLFIFAFLFYWKNGTPASETNCLGVLKQFWEASLAMLDQFVGTGCSQSHMDAGLLKYPLVFTRYILFGLFLSMFLKKFGRR